MRLLYDTLPNILKNEWATDGKDEAIAIVSEHWESRRGADGTLFSLSTMGVTSEFKKRGYIVFPKGTILFRIDGAMKALSNLGYIYEGNNIIDSHGFKVGIISNLPHEGNDHIFYVVNPINTDYEFEEEEVHKSAYSTVELLMMLVCYWLYKNDFNATADKY